MGSLGNIFLKFGADVSDIKSGVKGINTSLDGLKKNAEGIGKSLQFIGVVEGLSLVKNAFNSVSGIASSLIAEFDQDAKASAKLTTALQGNTGAAKELLSQASKLQNSRLFPDEVTANADALLATMGFQKDAIQELIPKIQDFASAWGLDLDDAAKKVGKSIVEGGDALKKYGVIVKEGSTVAERYTNINVALAKSFDGQAEAAAKAGSGPLQILAQQFGELKEKAGESLLAFVNVFIPDASTGVVKLTGFMDELPATMKRVAEALHPIVSLVGLVVAGVEKGQALVDYIGLGKAKEVQRTSGRGSAGISGSPELDKLAQEKIAKAEADRKIKENLKRIQDLLKGAGGNKGEKDAGKYINPVIQKIKNDEEEINKIFARLEPKIISYKDKIASIFDDRGRSANNVARGPIIDLAPLQNASTYVRPLNDQLTALNSTSEQLGLTWKEAANNIVSGAKEAQNASDQLAGAFDNIINAGISESLSEIGVQLGNLFTGGKFDFNALIAPLADVLINVGKLAIASGIAVTAIGKALASLHGIGAIVAGIALVALGTFVKASLGKSAAKFAKGGLSFGEHLATIGDNPNARFDPEVTAPSSKLKSLFENVTLPKLSSFIPNNISTGNIQPQVILLDGSFKISGNDLVLAYDRNRATQLRQRGY